MAIEPDHTIVSARDRRAAAALLARLLDVPWAEQGVGPFSPVFVSSGFTVDFVDDPSEFPIQHLCFRVDDATFDAILGRIRVAGIAYQSTPHGPRDMQINIDHGGRAVYWTEPDGHMWEILTVSYARRP